MQTSLLTQIRGSTFRDKLRKEIKHGLTAIQRSIDGLRDDFDRADSRGCRDTSNISQQIEMLQTQQTKLAARLGPEEAARVLEGLG